MKKRYYGIKNHKIVATMDISPFSVARMNAFAKQCGYDGWIELNKKSALTLMQLE